MITRYCDLQRQSAVTIGQQVIIGQVLGIVGESGNADGPHLRLEIHLRNDSGAAEAVDPTAYLGARGVCVWRAN